MVAVVDLCVSVSAFPGFSLCGTVVFVPSPVIGISHVLIAETLVLVGFFCDFIAFPCFSFSTPLQFPCCCCCGDDGGEGIFRAHGILLSMCVELDVVLTFSCCYC